MKKTTYHLVCMIFLTTLIMSFAGVLGQPMRTTKAITLFSQPSLNAPAPTYTKINSVVDLQGKADEMFWKVLYQKHLLFMHESSLQYCVPIDTVNEGKLVAPGDPVRRLKADPPWYTKEYGILNLNELTHEQYKKELRKSFWGISFGSIGTIAGTCSLAYAGCRWHLGINEENHWVRIGHFIGGFVYFGTGLIIEAIGLPLLIGSAAKRWQLNKAFPRNNTKISIIPYFDNELYQYSAGLTFRFTF
jgi:hypothetical protein